jgi:hypothetical protein
MNFLFRRLSCTPVFDFLSRGPKDLFRLAKSIVPRAQLRSSETSLVASVDSIIYAIFSRFINRDWKNHALEHLREPFDATEDGSLVAQR